MITIKSLDWDNWFSYGSGNTLNFTEDKVTQITGKNGSGKSSIPVILGEVLTGKNAFGKTKQKLFNRYLDKPNLYAELILDKDGIEYVIKYNRKSTLKLVLLEDGIDISSHSTTNTLKTINNLLGFEFKLLWELIYQSSTTGIAFLTATDTNRKKFLINLFSLDKYLEIHEQFKKISRDTNNRLLTLYGKQSTISSFIEKNEKEDLTLREVQPIPSVNKEDIDKLTNLKAQLSNITETNKKINLNNQYKAILNELDTSILSETINIAGNKNEIQDRINQLNGFIGENTTHINICKNEIAKIEKLDSSCPTCMQFIDIDFISNYTTERVNRVLKLQEENETYSLNKMNLSTVLNKINKDTLRLTEKNNVEEELQDLLSKIDNNIPVEILDEDELKDSIVDAQENIKNINDSIALITSVNMTAEAHNSKVKVIKEQLKEYKDQKTIIDKQIHDEEFVLSKITLLTKAYSTNGLPGYKIEFLAKDLEHQINTYLEELSNGRFQLIFALNGEKLDIDIIDDGKTIGIEELSAGELARINTSTLLAIRKLMSAISSTKINILFLDEIMGVLDDEGKEKLIDILNAETELNTFLVSHEFTHPLIPTINILKENKISRID